MLVCSAMSVLLYTAVKLPKSHYWKESNTDALDAIHRMPMLSLLPYSHISSVYWETKYLHEWMHHKASFHFHIQITQGCTYALI